MASPLHVLLVDDDPLAVFVLERKLLASEDVDAVTVALDGREALDRLRGPSLARARLVVLTDLYMPRMSGLELAAAIRDDPRLAALPILVLTTSTDAADRAAALALHVEGYFLRSSADRELVSLHAWLHAYRVGGAGDRERA